MKQQEKGFFNSTWFYRIISLILALVLFMYVNGSKDGFLRQTTRDGNTTALMSNKTVTMKMPLDLTVDSQRYVVSGYPQYVKVKISGPAALVTTTTNTQNFKVYANLRELGSGKHTVKLKTSGLNAELRATINPATIDVNIQPRTTTVKPVEVRLSAKTVNGNYRVGNPKAALNTVQVTGAKSEVKRVVKVIAMVNVPKDATSDLHRQVTLQAIDRRGRTVNVVVMPSTLNVTVPIDAGKAASETSTSSQAASETSASASSAADQTATDQTQTSKTQTSSSVKASSNSEE